MLYDYHKYFLNYLVLLYGGSYEVQGHILFMYSGKDTFKVSLLDGSRFNKFTFFHKFSFKNVYISYIMYM